MANILYVADKIGKKAESIAERQRTNREKALQLMDKLRDMLELHQFLQVS